jgi:hypothetical protein
MTNKSNTESDYISELNYICYSSSDPLTKSFITNRNNTKDINPIAFCNVIRIIALSTDDEDTFKYCSSLIDENTNQMLYGLNDTCWSEDVDFTDEGFKIQLRKAISDSINKDYTKKSVFPEVRFLDIDGMQVSKHSSDDDLIRLKNLVIDKYKKDIFHFYVDRELEIIKAVSRNNLLNFLIYERDKLIPEKSLNDIYHLAVHSDFEIPEDSLNRLINCYLDTMNLLLLKFNPLSQMQLHYIASNAVAWSNNSPDIITSNEAINEYLSNNRDTINSTSLKLLLRNITYLLDEYKDNIDDSFIFSIRDELDPFFKLPSYDF